MLLELLPGEIDTATVTEKDSDGYLEGYDDSPLIIGRRKIHQPMVGELIADVTREAMVLDNTADEEYVKISRALTIGGLREHGLQLRTQGIGLAIL